MDFLQSIIYHALWQIAHCRIHFNDDTIFGSELTLLPSEVRQSLANGFYEVLEELRELKYPILKQLRWTLDVFA